MPTFMAYGLGEALANLWILSRICATRRHEPDSYSRSRLGLTFPRTVQAEDEGYFLGPAYFLALCPNLDELELVHYSLAEILPFTETDGVFWQCGAPYPISTFAQIYNEGSESQLSRLETIPE